MNHFETYCKTRNIKAKFVDGELISPIPLVKVNNRIRTEPYFIQKVISKYSFSSVVEAMFNDKIILNL